MVDLDLPSSPSTVDDLQRKMADSKAGSGRHGQDRNRRKRPANTTGKNLDFICSVQSILTNLSLGPAQINQTQTFFLSKPDSTTSTSSQMPPRVTWRGLDGLRQ